MARTPVAFVEAVVRFPLYEGDRQDLPWTDFVYAEPGISETGQLGVCQRPCKTISAKVVNAGQDFQD